MTLVFGAAAMRIAGMDLRMTPAPFLLHPEQVQELEPEKAPAELMELAELVASNTESGTRSLQS